MPRDVRANQLAIGLTGSFGSGCSEAARIPAGTGDSHAEALSKCIKDEAKKRGLKRERRVPQDLGDDLRKRYGLHVSAKRALSAARKDAPDHDSVLVCVGRRCLLVAATSILIAAASFGPGLGVASSAGQHATPRVLSISKWQPVFLIGREARFSVRLGMPQQVDDELNFFIYISDQTRHRGDLRTLVSHRLADMALAPGESSRTLAVTLPSDLRPGTFYAYAAIVRSPDLDPAAIISHDATKVALVARDLEHLSLADALDPVYLSASGQPDLPRIRAHILEQRSSLGAGLGDLATGGLTNAVALADAFVQSQQYPLEFCTVEYEPGPSFWQDREQSADMLALHSLRMVTILLSAFDATGNRCYLTGAAALYEDWAEHCAIDSFRSQHAWGDHAVPVRLCSIVALGTRLCAEPGYEELLAAILTDVHRHCEILREWGFFSSWSNHGVFQIHALLGASVVCDVLAASQDWQETALHRTSQWLDGKILQDGALNEGTTSYHFAVLRLMMEIRALGRHAGRWDSELDRTLRRMVVFGQYLTKPDGNTLAFGDCGVHSEPRGLDSLRAALAEPGQERAEFDQGPPSSIGIFPDSGYFFFVSDPPGSDSDVYIAFDFGVSTRATHFQDDTMNFELMLLGHTIVQDSGVSSRANAAMVRYLKSARAHSTILFNEVDAPYASRSVEEMGIEGYLARRDCCEFSAHMVTAEGSWLRRSIRVYAIDGVVVVRDVFATGVKPGATLLFQYAPDVEASLREGGIDLAIGAVNLRHHLASDSSVTVEIARGQREPELLGWACIDPSATGPRPRWTAAVHCPDSTGEVVSVFAPAGVDIAPYLSDF